MQPPGWKEKGFGTAGFMDLEAGKSQEGRGDPGGQDKETSSGSDRHRNGRRASERKNIGNKGS